MFSHIGHGSAFDESWGSPACIDDMYLKNPKEPTDLLPSDLQLFQELTLNSVSLRKKLIHSSLPKSSSKLFDYKKFNNEKPSRPPLPKFNQSNGVVGNDKNLLIDISPSKESSRKSVQRDSLVEMSILDTPIDVHTDDYSG